MLSDFDFNLYVIALLIGLILLVLFNVYFFGFKLVKYVRTRSKFRFKRRYFYHYSFLINIIFLVGFVLAGYLLYTNITPKIIHSTPRTETTWESYDKPIEITFNVPVDASRLVENMNPLIKGNWEWEPYLGINRLTKIGRFYPSETLFPNERIVIYITGIARIRNSEGHEGGIVLQSVDLPEVRATYPFHQRKDIKIDENFKVLLTKPADDLADISFELSPEIELTVLQETPTLYSLTPKSNLLQSTDYDLIVKRVPKRVNLETNEVLEKDNSQNIHDLKFSTVKEPFIKSITPKGTGVKVNGVIRFRFETDMNKEVVESKIDIKPDIQGTYSWKDDRTLIFTPSEPMPKETKFKVTINPGLESPVGGVSEKTIVHEFETIGKIRISRTTPVDDEVRVNINTNISVTFDQEVDQKSAQGHFTISPAVGGSFSWEDNTLIFDPNDLSFGTKYTVTLLPGIKSIYGLNNDQPMTFVFTTRGQEVIISMPWYAQPQSPVSFTCNIVSAQMALAWKGFNTTAAGLISELGYDSGYADGHWTGNPYEEFVGCADGYCGYGVYWTALQRLFNNRGITTEIRTGWNINQLANSIENGRPVIIWRYNGTSANADRDWVASDGTYIDGISGQHGGVVTGYRGTVENPTAFYINDPWFGLIWMDIGTFDYYWSRLNRSALIIY